MNRKHGFTLIEIILVVVIIGILAALVMPRLFGQAEKAKQKAALGQIAIFKKSLAHYEMDAGAYPSTGDGLDALVNRPTSLGPDVQWERYLDTIPKDPWVNAYIYRRLSDEEYEVYSTGADGKPDTEDDIGRE